MFNFSKLLKNSIFEFSYKVVAIIAATLLCFFALPFDGSVVEAAKVKTVVIGYYTTNTNFQSGYSDEVRKSGYAYDYYQELLKYTDWKYEYYYGTTDEINEALINGEVDIVAGIPKTEALKEKLLYPNNPMGAEGLYIYCSPDRQNQYGKPLSFAGQKIGYAKNNTVSRALEDYINTLPTKMKLVAYDTIEERDKAFSDGDVRLIVASDNLRPENTKPVVKIGSVDYYFALNPDRDDLLSDLNIAQTKILDANPSYSSMLQQKYFVNGSSSDDFTSEDIRYLEKNDIIIGSVKGMSPYSDCDEKGNPQGLIAEIANRLTELSGKDTKVVFYDTYREMHEALLNEEVTVIFPVYDDPWYAEEQGLILTQSFATDRIAILFCGVYNYENTARVAYMEQSSVLEEQLMDLYGKEITAKPYNSFADCLKALEKNEVDIVVCGTNILSRYLSDKDLDKRIQVAYTNNDESYCIGIPEGQTTLYSIFNKVYSSTDKSVFENAVILNSYVKNEYGFKDFVKHYYGVLVGILFILAVAISITGIYHNINVKRHNDELKILNAQLMDKIEVIKQQKLDMRIDSLTQVNNRFRMEEYLNELLEEYNEYGRSTLYLAVMDLDKFKAINDDFGHAVGDEALITTATVLKKACKNTSVFLARYGGDEFIMACEADNERDFTKVLNRIQPLLDEENKNKPYKLQVSIGVASHKTEKETLEEWFKRADEAQYIVKQEHHAKMV